MTTIKQVNGTLSIEADTLTVLSSGAMASGSYHLCATADGESMNSWELDPESELVVGAGNQCVQGDNVTVNANTGNGTANIYMKTTNSTGTLTGQAIALSYSDAATNNSFTTNAVNSMINFNDSKDNYAETQRGSNTILFGANSSANVAKTGIGSDAVYVGGQYNTVIGGGGTTTYNIQDGAYATLIMGASNGSETVNDKAGATSGGYTLYVGRGSNVEINSSGSKMIGNLMNNASSSVNMYGSCSKFFNSSGATDLYGRTQDYNSAINLYGWNSSNFYNELGWDSNSYVAQQFKKQAGTDFENATNTQ